jgi:hypothetical protein
MASGDFSKKEKENKVKKPTNKQKSAKQWQ